MFENFYYGLQQSFKLFLVFPILCGILRFIFILANHPYGTLKGRWGTVWGAMRYGFWWGMDYNAYVFLVGMILVALPGAFIDAYASVGDWVLILLGAIYGTLIYIAYMGKLIFYKHFGDVYNYLVNMGKHADKKILIGVFFRQDHGGWIIAGYFLYLPLLVAACYGMLQLPSLGYYSSLTDGWRYAANTAVVLFSVAGFYWVRYGGTFMHDNKPEWDTIPTDVKEDVFLAKATVDDLVALKWVKKRSFNDGFTRSEEALEGGVQHVLQQLKASGSSTMASSGVNDAAVTQGATNPSSWDGNTNPLWLCRHEAEGARIAKPKHVFLIVGESIPQWPMEDLFAEAHVMDGVKGLSQSPTAWTIPHVLPSGNISRPSIVSLMSGLFDSQFELNEREAFWQGTVPTSFARQMKALGYRSIYWYGGNASNGNFNKFGKAQGFDEVRSAMLFCGQDAPKTWVGVYDDVYLKTVSEQLKAIDEPTFHFVYTTSNHGPYKIPDSVLDFKPDRDMPDMPEAIRRDKKRCKEIATGRYADRAITDFVHRIQDEYPDSLIIITGDHSNCFTRLAGSDWLPRDWSIHERFCTMLTFIHPELPAIKPEAGKGPQLATHMQIMPTVMELLAPKGFTYYSMQPSLFDNQLPIVGTPQQWFYEGYLGASEEANKIEPISRSVRDVLPNGDASAMATYKPVGEAQMQAYRDFTAWIVRHEKECLLPIE